MYGGVYKELEENIDETQFWFRNGLGIREALFCIQVLVQSCRGVNNNVYLYSIDFEKAFDNVCHDKMLEILDSSGTDDKDLRIISNLYSGQTAEIVLEQHFSEE